jgi:hypothetical protein
VLHEADLQQSPVLRLDSRQLSERHKEEELVSRLEGAGLFREVRPEKGKWLATTEVIHQSECPFGHFVQLHSLVCLL